MRRINFIQTFCNVKRSLSGWDAFLILITVGAVASNRCRQGDRFVFDLGSIMFFIILVIIEPLGKFVRSVGECSGGEESSGGKDTKSSLTALHRRRKNAVHH